MEMDLPQTISFSNETIYGAEINFVKECYPEGELKNELTARERQKVKIILKEVAYAKFIEQQENEGIDL